MKIVFNTKTYFNNDKKKIKKIQIQYLTLSHLLGDICNADVK